MFKTSDQKNPRLFSIYQYYINYHQKGVGGGGVERDKN